MEASRVVAVAPDRAFDVLLTAPRETVFSRRYGAFPPVREVRDQVGDWDTVGQTRILVMTESDLVRETLTAIDRPHGFDYLLDDIRGRLRPMVRRIEGRWSVEPEGEGSRISWTWTLHPRRPPARLTMNVLGSMWQGYADRALQQVEGILVD